MFLGMFINLKMGGKGMKTRTYVLNIGFNDKITKMQEINTEKCKQIVTELAINLFPYGGTLQDTIGMFKHEDGQTVFEHGLQITLVTDDEKSVKRLIENIKKELNQESVMLRIFNGIVKFL